MEIIEALIVAVTCSGATICGLALIAGIAAGRE